MTRKEMERDCKMLMVTSVFAGPELKEQLTRMWKSHKPLKERWLRMSLKLAEWTLAQTHVQIADCKEELA